MFFVSSNLWSSKGSEPKGVTVIEKFYCVFDQCAVCAFIIMIVLVFTEATVTHADPHGREAVHVFRLW